MMQLPPNGNLSLTPRPTAALAAVDPSQFLPRVDGGRWVKALFRRWWIPALCAAVAGAGMWTYLKKTPPVYVAYGSVYVNAEAPRLLDIKPVSQEESRDLEQMRSVEQSLLSTTVLLRVVEANHLREAPGFLPASTVGAVGDEALVGFLRKRIKVELSRGTRIIGVNVEDTDPARAAALVTSLVTEYQKESDERQRENARQALGSLGENEKVLADRAAASEKRLQEFREANPTMPLEGQANGGVAGGEVQALTAELSRVRSERLRLEAEFDALKSIDPSNTGAILRLGKSERLDEVASLVRAINEKEATFASLKQRYLEKHPKFIEAQNELDQLRTSLLATAASVGRALEKSYHVALENENKLGLELERASKAAVVVEGTRGRFESLRAEAAADRELHQSVSRRVRETELAAAMVFSALRWNDRPVLPEKPAKPAKKVLFGMAVSGGMFFGLLIALLAELRDRTVRDEKAAGEASGLPHLASVPQGQHPAAGHVVVLQSDPGSVAAEAFRTLRTSLVPPSLSEAVRSVLFTSASAGEGKSFCALNYAASLALQGNRTLLIDADLRRPGLSADLLQAGAERPGLSDYLAGRADPAKACFETGVPNLYLLSSGLAQPNAAELLSGTRFPVLLEEAYRWFDRVVIDTPPALSASDALAIARYADLTCLIVKKGLARKPELAQTSSVLRASGARLAGFVWNGDTDRHAPPPYGGIVGAAHPSAAALGSEDPGSFPPDSPAISTSSRQVPRVVPLRSRVPAQASAALDEDDEFQPTASV